MASNLTTPMKLPLFQVDAFANRIFSGNPAAVVPLPDWLADDVMQNIATENQLSETAFFVEEKDSFQLRWFTPATEVDLCGHATLASAHVLYSELGYGGERVIFQTRSGALEVTRTAGGYEMDFPTDPPERAPSVKDILSSSLGIEIAEAFRGREDYVAIVESESDVRNLEPDIRAVAHLEARGVLVSAAGEEVDFVSRCFFPRFGIDEDPVTGSAHTTLAPLWAERLGRKRLTARQISRRGGEVECRFEGERVVLAGEATTFLRGEMELPDA